MADKYLNQAAAEWARGHLAQEVEINLRGNSWPARILVALAMLFLGVIFFGIPAISFASAASRYFAQGWTAEVSRAVWMGLFFLAGFGGLAAFLFFYLLTLRRKLVRLLSADGVTTRGGKKYRWENLQYLNYVTVDPRFVAGRRTYHILLRALSRHLFAGVENVKVEMVFSDGTATLAPLIEDQRAALDLLNTIPVRRTLDGTIRSLDELINWTPD